MHVYCAAAAELMGDTHSRPGHGTYPSCVCCAYAAPE